MKKRSILLPLLLLGTPVGAASPDQTASRPADAEPLRCPMSGAYDPANPFARIIRGELPASVIARNARVMAFIPLGWKHPGHALVIPTRSVRNLYDLNDDELVEIMRMIRRVSIAQQHALGSTGFSLEQNNGRNQEVCHLHFHVIPNTPEAVTGHAMRAEMDAMARRLETALPGR